MMPENQQNMPKQLSQAMIFFTGFMSIFIVFFVAPLCYFLFPNTPPIVTVVPPTPSPTLSPTPTKAVITVEYKLEIYSQEPVVQANIWYTSGAENQNIVDNVHLTNTRPFTTTIKAEPYQLVEFSGVLPENIAGQLTCKIFVGKNLVEQRTRSGKGSGVYCSGIVISP
jgi:hypothetical protein